MSCQEIIPLIFKGKKGEIDFKRQSKQNFNSTTLQNLKTNAPLVIVLTIYVNVLQLEDSK